MPATHRPLQGEIVLYQTKDGRTCVECRFAAETLWLSQALIAELSQVAAPTVNEYLKNIYDEFAQLVITRWSWGWCNRCAELRGDPRQHRVGRCFAAP
ncbi:MAG: hypothetical protein ACLP9L_25725 [Thermoguttaceae bacterium]